MKRGKILNKYLIPYNTAKIQVPTDCLCDHMTQDYNQSVSYRFSLSQPRTYIKHACAQNQFQSFDKSESDLRYVKGHQGQD